MKHFEENFGSLSRSSQLFLDLIFKWDGAFVIWTSDKLLLCLKLNILLKKVVFIIQRKLNNNLSISKKIGIAIDLGLFRAMCPIGKYSTHHDYIAICGCNVDRYRLILWITFPQYMDQDKWSSFLTHLIKNERHGLASFLKNSNAIFQENDTIDLICKNYGHSVYLIDQRSLLESELKSFYEKDLKINQS